MNGRATAGVSRWAAAVIQKVNFFFNMDIPAAWSGIVADGGSVPMKTIVATVAVLLLVSTFAMAAGYQPLPFPQSANTALASQAASTSMSNDMPSAMATNQSSDVKMVASGSPFPSAANPSIGSNTTEETTPALEHQRDLGSPFPSVANPSHR